MDIDEKIMTVDEVAKWLRASPNTIRELIKTNKLRAFRAGAGKRGRYRIPFQAVLEWQNRDQNKQGGQNE